MRERGDLGVLHEPFMYDYYLNQNSRIFADFTPEPGHPTRYSTIRDMILDKARQGPVFFKDMAYYVTATLPDDAAFRDAIQHGFLLRHPAESILSYAKREPDFSCEEVGIEAEWALYQSLKAAGHDPVVILSDDLRAKPGATMRRYWARAGLADCPDALAWDGAVPQGWESVQKWHGDVLASGAIRPPEGARDYSAELAALGGPYAGYLAHHLPFYERLRDVALHQK